MSAETKPSHRVIRSFREWEVRFDAALKEPDDENLGPAWQTLIDHGCDDRALRQALYYAALCTDRARSSAREMEAFLQNREAALRQTAELKQTLLGLTGAARVTDDLLKLWQIKGNEAKFFKNFATSLHRFEVILNTLTVPGRMKRPDVEVDSEIARGEALLHVYVEVTTEKLFPEKTSVLLEVSAACYGVKPPRPSYDSGAVSRRFGRWFRSRKDNNYKEMCLTVRGLRGGDTFLRDFLYDTLLIHSLPFGLFQHITFQFDSPDEPGEQGCGSRWRSTVSEPSELVRTSLNKYLYRRKRVI